MRDVAHGSCATMTRVAGKSPGRDEIGGRRIIFGNAQCGYGFSHGLQDFRKTEIHRRALEQLKMIGKQSFRSAAALLI